MKTMCQSINLVIITFLSLLSLTSCENLTTCEEVEKSEMVMLFDISDEELFAEINEDITTNFSHFMSQTKFANVQECQVAKLSVGNLSAKDELKMKSASVGITEKGLSGHEMRKRGNPTPVVQLVKESLLNYTEMSQDATYNSSTNILGTMVKSIVGLDTESENTLVLFTDGVIFNKVEDVNFYKSIPTDVNSTIRKLIDPFLLKNLEDKLTEGLEINIIVVLKDEQGGKVKKRDVKTFWSHAFKALNIDDVQYIDNLSNKIQWEN